MGPAPRRFEARTLTHPPACCLTAITVCLAKEEINELREIETRLANIQLSFQSNDLELLARDDGGQGRQRTAVSRRSGASTPLWRIVQVRSLLNAAGRDRSLKGLSWQRQRHG